MPKTTDVTPAPEPDATPTPEPDATQETGADEPEWVESRLSDALRYEPVWLKVQAIRVYRQKPHPGRPNYQRVRVDEREFYVPDDVPVMRRRARVARTPE